MVPAVFLDRDGTLVHDPGYLADPSDVRLIDGAAEAIAMLRAAGFRCIVITNQSGIGRGMITPAAYASVEREVASQLAALGAAIDATYHCPHHPDAGCPCRKPGTALHREAAAAHQLDLPASWMIGDRPGDLAPAAELGARAILVETGDGALHADAARASGHVVVQDLRTAARHVIAHR